MIIRVIENVYSVLGGLNDYTYSHPLLRRLAWLIDGRCSVIAGVLEFSGLLCLYFWERDYTYPFSLVF